MRRGLTLLELLLALALLTGVSAAILPLTRVALGGMHEIDRQLLWKRSADMTLAEIDLLLLRRDHRESRDHPVKADSKRLTIRLAGGSMVTLTNFGDQLQFDDGAQAPEVLLGDLEVVAFELDDEHDALTIALTSMYGQTAERVWRLDR